MKTFLQTLTALIFPALCPAAEPYSLQHTIPAPPGGGAQTLAGLGEGVAIDGALTVAGVPYDDTGNTNSGVVKVFDTVTGALLHVIPNPAPGTDDYFGSSVAISGTLVVVGAYMDDTWARDVGSAFVFDLSGATPTVPIATLDNPEPSEGDFFGYRVAVSGRRVVIIAFFGDALSPEAGSAWVYDMAGATPGVPLFALSKLAPAAFDSFGRSVGISGARVAVGATGDDTAGTNKGAVYVYDLSGTTPAVPVTALTNPDPGEPFGFGFPVAISGTRVAVGDTRRSYDERVYVYDLAGAAPMAPVAIFNKPGIPTDDDFGASVAIAGTRVAVGAPADGSGTTTGGRAYVFDLESPTLTLPVLTLINHNPAIVDRFGNAVAISSNMLVVAANYDDTGASGAGSAYVYNMTGGTPAVSVATLNHPGPAGGGIGWAIALDGTRMVAGAAADLPGARYTGGAYVYDLAGGTPTAPAVRLSNPDPSDSDVFGASVAISGTRAVVGATHNDAGAANAGSAYVYDLSGAAPGESILTLNNPHPAVDDHFGNAVAISGTRVVAGAWFDDAGNTGIVYVYDIAGAAPAVPAFTLPNPTPATTDVFGSAVAIDGTRVVVAAHSDSPGANFAGTVYVYDLAGATPTVPIATLNKPAPVERDHFGASVAISGTRVIVGVDHDDTGAPDAGSALLYDLSGETPTVPAAIFHNPTPAVTDFFGQSVAISGSQVVIGAPNDRIGVEPTGSAYIYDVESATPTVPVATLHNPGPVREEWFGSSVAIDGSTVAIAAPGDGSLMPSRGLVYIYGPNLLDQDTDGLPDSWELTHWSTTTGHSATDDFDNDGYEELLELAFGLNPLRPDRGGLPPVTVEDGYLTMTIMKQPGAVYEVQSATTLGPNEPLSFSPAHTRVLLDNATTLKTRDHFLIGRVPKRFLRVKVAPAP